VRRLPVALFVLALVATAAYVIATVPALPERVASHFGAGGRPDGWMTRDGYRLFMLAFGVALPLVVVGAVGVLPRFVPGGTNVPNRDYWFAGDRREASLDFMLAHACWLGVLMETMIAAVHWRVLAANAATPVALATAPFVALLVAFFILLAVWIVVLYRRFRLPR
jgi:uncharacterized membrane protein